MKFWNQHFSTGVSPDTYRENSRSDGKTHGFLGPKLPSPCSLEAEEAVVGPLEVLAPTLQRRSWEMMGLLREWIIGNRDLNGIFEEISWDFMGYYLFWTWGWTIKSFGLTSQSIGYHFEDSMGFIANKSGDVTNKKNTGNQSFSGVRLGISPGGRIAAIWYVGVSQNGVVGPPSCGNFSRESDD